MARKLFTAVDIQMSTTAFDEYTSIAGKSPPYGTLRCLDQTEHYDLLEINTSSTTFSGIAGTGGLRKGSVYVLYDGLESFLDDGLGVITGTGISSCTVDYDSGLVTLTLDAAPTDPKSVAVKFKTIKSALGGEYVAGTITFPEWKAEGLVELFGFETREAHQNITLGDVNVPITDIRYQISVNGGTTWKFWNGSEWATAVSEDDFNGWETIDQNINSLAFSSSYGSKSITIRAKLYPDADGKYSPKLLQISVLHELQYEFFDDVLVTFKRNLDSNIRITTHQVDKATASQTQFKLRVGEEQTTDSSPSIDFYQPITNIRVYNLTTDAGKTTPLTHTFDSNRTVTLATGASVNSQIFISYDVTVPTIIGSDARITNSTSRAIYLNIDSSNINPIDHAKPDYTEIEPDFKNREVRKRVPSQIQNLDCIFSVQSPNSADVHRIASAVFKFFEKNRRIKSVYTGQNYEIVNQSGAFNDTAQMGTTIYTKNFSIEIRGRVYYPDYITEPMVVEVNVPISSTKPYEQISIVNIVEDDKVGKLTPMSYTISKPGIEVWDRNGIRAGMYASIPAAIASLDSHGGKIVLGPGVYDFTSTNYFTVNKPNVTIEGSGWDTILMPTITFDSGQEQNTGLIFVQIGSDNFCLRNLQIMMPSPPCGQDIVTIESADMFIDNVWFNQTGPGTGDLSSIHYISAVTDTTFPSAQANDALSSTLLLGGKITNCKFTTNRAGLPMQIRKRRGTIITNNIVTSNTIGTNVNIRAVLAHSRSSGTIFSHNIMEWLGTDATHPDTGASEDGFISVVREKVESSVANSDYSDMIFSDNIVRNCVFKGNAAPLQLIGTVNYKLCDNIFDRCTSILNASSVVSDFIFVDLDGSSLRANNVLISGNLFKECGYSTTPDLISMIKITRADNVQVESNKFIECFNPPIWIQTFNTGSSSGNPRNIKITGNRFKASGTITAPIGIGSSAVNTGTARARGWIIENNTYENYTQDSIVGSGPTLIVDEVYFVRNNVRVPSKVIVTAANFTNSTLTIRETNAFTGYTFAAGDDFVLEGGNGCTLGVYPISSSTASTIVITSAVAGGSDVTDGSIRGYIRA